MENTEWTRCAEKGEGAEPVLAGPAHPKPPGGSRLTALNTLLFLLLDFSIATMCAGACVRECVDIVIFNKNETMRITTLLEPPLKSQHSASSILPQE